MFKFGSLGCKMLIAGLIVILLAGVFGIVTGPSLREEIRMQQYHAWALEFEEAYPCIDVIGVAENPYGDPLLEIYLRGIPGDDLQKAGADFYSEQIDILVEIAERWGFPVEYVLAGFAPKGFPHGFAVEVVLTEIATHTSKAYPGDVKVPEYMQLWEGRGE